MVGTNGNVPPFVPNSNTSPCPSLKEFTHEDYRTPPVFDSPEHCVKNILEYITERADIN